MTEFAAIVVSMIVAGVGLMFLIDHWLEKRKKRTR